MVDAVVAVAQNLSGWLQIVLQLGMMGFAWLIGRQFAVFSEWRMIWLWFSLGFMAMLATRVLVLLIAWGYLSPWIDVTQRYIMPLLGTLFLFLGLYLLHHMFAQFPQRSQWHELPEPAGINIDEGSMVTAWDGQATAMFGYAASEAMGRSLATLIIPTRYHARHFRGVRTYIENRDRMPLSAKYEVMARHQDGREFDVVVRISVVPQADGHLQFAGTINRVTYHG